MCTGGGSEGVVPSKTGNFCILENRIVMWWIVKVQIIRRWKQNSSLTGSTDRPKFPGGGHWPRKGVWGCAAVMTPFFQASRRSLAYQFTIIAPLICPPFSNFRNFFHFQPCFGQNFSFQDVNFPNFCSLDPSFFKENPLPRPYFWKPVWHIPTKKKSWVPPGPKLRIMGELCGTDDYTAQAIPLHQFRE